MKTIFGAFVLVVLALAPSIASALEIDAVGAIGFSGAYYNSPGSNAEVSSKLNLGFGGLVSFTLIPFVELQPGVLYLPRKFSIDTPTSGFSKDQEYSFSTLQFPLLLRFTPVDVFSIGFGPYFSEGIGNVSQSTSYNGAVLANEQTFEQAGLNKFDYGAEISVAAKYPIAPTLSLIGDLRYLYGLRDLSTTPQTDIDTRDFQLLLGIAVRL